MSDKIIEKLDAIEASNESKIQEVKTEAVAAIEAAKAEMDEKLETIKARVAEINTAPSIIKPAKSIKEDVNKMVREQLKKFAKKGSMEKELKMFEDESQYQASLILFPSNLF